MYMVSHVVNYTYSYKSPLPTSFKHYLLYVDMVSFVEIDDALININTEQDCFKSL